jgi:hypothetical protein
MQRVCSDKMDLGIRWRWFSQLYGKVKRKNAMSLKEGDAGDQYSCGWLCLLLHWRVLQLMSESSNWMQEKLLFISIVLVLTPYGRTPPLCAG